MLSKEELLSRFKNEIYPQLSDDRKDDILRNFESLTPASQEEILNSLLQLLNDGINNRNIAEVGKIIDTGIEDKREADREYESLLDQFSKEVAPNLSSSRRDEITAAFSGMEVEEQRKMLSEFRKILQRYKDLDLSADSEITLEKMMESPENVRSKEHKPLERVR